MKYFDADGIELHFGDCIRWKDCNSKIRYTFINEANGELLCSYNLIRDVKEYDVHRVGIEHQDEIMIRCKNAICAKCTYLACADYTPDHHLDGVVINSECPHYAEHYLQRVKEDAEHFA